MKKTDVIVIGTGVAGLNTACQLSSVRPDLKIMLITKSSIKDSNSSRAQGGIAISHANKEDVDSHAVDTYIAGGGHTSIEVITNILSDAPMVLDQLKLYDLQFDLKEDNNLDYTIEGGHSKRRIVHVKDFTGKAVIDAMVKRVRKNKNIVVLEQHTVTELLVDRVDSNGITCRGVKLVENNTKRETAVYASSVVLATGGVGSLYAKSTNVAGTNGDGLFLAEKVGAELQDLEFVQFHPTGLYGDLTSTTSLISEAIRGEGGVLYNAKLERFMEKYDDRLELAPRDVVSRAAIAEEIATGNPFVYLDCTHFEKRFFQTRFPGIIKSCLESDIDPFVNKIPVTPVQHFLCGGIRTNEKGETTVKRLFACGECACTGLHGANRLASNSLLECLIMSNRIAQNISKCLDVNNVIKVDRKESLIQYRTSNKTESYAQRRYRSIRELMMHEVGVLRTTNGLSSTLETLGNTISEIESLNNDRNDWNLIDLEKNVRVAYLLTQAARKRKQNSGCHFNLNHAADGEDK